MTTHPVDPALDRALEHLAGAGETELALAIATDLDTIRGYWRATEMAVRSGGLGTATTGSRLPGPTVELRADATLTLAYWAHALVDEWPSATQRLEHDRVPHPTTDPLAYEPWQQDGPMVVVTDPYDLGDVPDLCRLLSRNAAALAAWQDGTPGQPGHQHYGRRLAAELQVLARTIRYAVDPPRREQIHLGACPTCGSPVNAHPTARAPLPSTDLEHQWTTIPATDPWAWANSTVRHRCAGGAELELTLEQWHRAMLGRLDPMPAERILEELHRRLGVRYSTVTVRVWATRGHIGRHGTTATGHARYDLAEVLAHVVASQALRDGTTSRSA